MVLVLSTLSLPAEPRTDDRQRDAQTFQKNEDTENCQPCRHQERRTPAKTRAAVGANDNEQRQRNRHAQTAYDKPKNDNRNGNQDEPLDRERADRRARYDKRSNH